MHQELKPCPFCGGEAVFQTSNRNLIVRCFVACTKCGIETPRTYRTWDEVKEVWNRRINDSPVINYLCPMWKAESKTEAIKEFAEKLKKELSFGKYIQADQIDNLVKEMVGEKNG